jgi:hypothetical protein
MKIRRTCKLPKEILGVGYALAGIAAIVAGILGLQFITVNYGPAVMVFLTKNAIVVGYTVLFLIWAIPSWVLEENLKDGQNGDRWIVTVGGTILALVVAAME